MSWYQRKSRHAFAILALFASDWKQIGARYALGTRMARTSEWGWLRLRILSVRGKKAFRSLRSRILAPVVPKTLETKPGILFLGYVEAGLGLGESLRGLVKAYSGGSLPFAVYPFNEGVETRWIGAFMPERYDRTGCYDVVVMEMAADQVPKVFETIHEDILKNSRKVLRTYWELPSAPAAWKPMLSEIDEIWAPNSFVADAFRDIYDGDIVVVPPCIEPETERLPTRRRYGLEENRFYFLFTFDYYSYPERKNPQAVLEAFRLAFPDPSEAVGLVIKSTGSTNHYPELKRIFMAAAKVDSRIHILDETMSRVDAHGLIAVCDCYVSLHRAEGFGFGMAEAMYYGRPVIGTRYSGNVDFLTDETGFPVDFHIRPVREGEYVWPRGQVWAEPDLSSAVEAFQIVYCRPDLRRQRAEAGAALIRSNYGAEAVRGAIEKRMAEIGH